MGFDRNHLVEALRSRIQNEVSDTHQHQFPPLALVSYDADPGIFIMNQATVAYYLLLDNRLRASNGYLGVEFQESMVSISFVGKLS